MGLPHVICMAAPPQFNANAQLVCLNGQQSQAIDTFLNASSTDDGQVGTPYRVYLWHYLYVIQLAVFKFFISLLPLIALYKTPPRISTQCSQ